MMDTEDIPLERWIELAICTDNVLFANQSMNNPSKGRAFSSKQANLSNTLKPWVSKEEMNCRRKEGLCLRCAKKGHFISKCTQREYTTQSKPEAGKAADVEKEDNDKSTEGSEN